MSVAEGILNTGFQTKEPHIIIPKGLFPEIEQNISFRQIKVQTAGGIVQVAESLTKAVEICVERKISKDRIRKSR